MAQTTKPEPQKSACVEILLPNAIVDIERLCFETGCEHLVRIQHRRDRLVTVISKESLPPSVDYGRLQAVVENLIEFVAKAGSFEVARVAVSKLLSEINIHINPKWVVAVWLDACGP